MTVSGGEPVDNENSAYALASCDACTTLAVSFQLVLVVGQTDQIMPINVAEALNLNARACITTAIAKQIVISLPSAPSDELLRRLTEELKKLDAIDTSDSPADVLDQVNAVTEAIQRALDESGVTYPKATPTPHADADGGRDAGGRRRHPSRPPAQRRPRRRARHRRRSATPTTDADGHSDADRDRYADGDRHAGALSGVTPE